MTNHCYIYIFLSSKHQNDYNPAAAKRQVEIEVRSLYIHPPRLCTVEFGCLYSLGCKVQAIALMMPRPTNVSGQFIKVQDEQILVGCLTVLLVLLCDWLEGPLSLCPNPVTGPGEKGSRLQLVKSVTSRAGASRLYCRGNHAGRPGQRSLHLAAKKKSARFCGKKQGGGAEKKGGEKGSWESCYSSLAVTSDWESYYSSLTAAGGQEGRIKR